MDLTHTHTEFKTCKKLLTALRIIPYTMFNVMGHGLPLQLLSLPPSFIILQPHWLFSFPTLGPLQLLFLLPAILFPAHFHKDNTSFPSDLCFNVTSSEASSHFLKKISFILFSLNTVLFIHREKFSIYLFAYLITICLIDHNSSRGPSIMSILFITSHPVPIK